MKLNSVLRFDGRGFAYACVDMEDNFHEFTTFTMQVTGNFEPEKLAEILDSLLVIRNTNPYDVQGEEKLHYYSIVSETYGSLEFNYLGNGVVSILVNKSRVLYSGEANFLYDFVAKLKEIKNVG